MSKEFTLPQGDGKKVCVGGGAGFIGSHIAKRLKGAGWHVTCVDWKKNEFMENDELCDEFILGDLRKLELARTLATNPEMILLDEVFAGLTVGEIGQITDLLQQKRREGMSMVIVSHDLRSLQPLIDRAVAITYGSVVAEGKYDDVIADEAVRSAYLGL